MRHHQPRRDETSRCVSSRALFATRIRHSEIETARLTYSTCEFPSAAREHTHIHTHRQTHTSTNSLSFSFCCSLSLPLSLSLFRPHSSSPFQDQSLM
jgi:hypothetical protein